MKTILKIMVAIIAVVVLFAVGCTVLVGTGLDQAQKDSDEHSITLKQFKQVKMGTPLPAVKKDLGVPASTDHQQVKGLKMDCIYYNVEGELASLYQFCFSNGSLDSKGRS